MGGEPETFYARSGDAHIAFGVLGDGPIDIVYIPNFSANDVEQRWHTSVAGALTRRLARYGRVIMFDKRGTGLSGRVLEMPIFEQQMDDIVAVLDAVGSTQTAIIGNFDGAPLAALFAATFPHRTRALVTWMLAPRVLWAADYPWGLDPDTYEHWINQAHEGVGLDDLRQQLAPSRDDESTRRFYDRVFRMYAGPAGLSGMLRMWAGMDLRPVLATIRVPTLVLHRADGVLIPSGVGRYVAHAITGARYVELDGNANGLEPEDIGEVGDEIQEFLTGTRPRVDHDRVLATILFTDVVGSTQHTVQLGDRRWRDLMARHDDVVRRHLLEFRGVEVNTMGDAFLARFDGPARAVQCAVAIRDALRPLGVEIRSGVHTGEIELVDDDVSGIAITIAKRIETIAPPGQVLVSRTVVDLVAGSGIEFVDHGEQELKGVPGTWRLFAVVN
jgi:class 3 adenylate cyclase